MTNTVNNVPRELLADLLGNDHDKRIMAERHLLAMLANAPSPAGVDGLEVVAYIWSHEKGITVPTMRNKPPFWPGKGGYTSEPLCRLSDAHAIIDGLRGEVGAQRVKTCIALKERNDAREERDQQAQRIGELEGLLRESGKTIHKLQAEQPTPARIARYLDAMRGQIDAALSAGKEEE